MFITEVLVGGGVVLECRSIEGVTLKGDLNVLVTEY